jgi:hypothetical protein
MSAKRIYRPIAIALAGGMAALTPLASLGDKGPTATWTGALLKDEIDLVLYDSYAQDMDVMDAGSLDIPCGTDRAKRRYEVKATRYYPGLDDPAELVDEITGTLLAIYKLTNRETGPLGEPTSALRDKKHHTTITVSSPHRGQIRIIGTTDCLRTR